jgi:hypothetical protein
MIRTDDAGRPPLAGVRHHPPRRQMPYLSTRPRGRTANHRPSPPYPNSTPS